MEDLIDPATHSWDEALIRSIFLPIDMERILKIPLSKHLLEDFVAWHYNKTGFFSVKTAYHMEWDHQHGRKLRQTNSVLSSSTSPVWRILWKLRVPAKVKVHVWRALYGAIPCRGVLANRHMITTSDCPICEADCESVGHSFFRCNRVQEIWTKLGLLPTINELYEAELEGSSVLGDLLLMPNATVPSLPG